MLTVVTSQRSVGSFQFTDYQGVESRKTLPSPESEVHSLTVPERGVLKQAEMDARQKFGRLLRLLGELPADVSSDPVFKVDIGQATDSRAAYAKFSFDGKVNVSVELDDFRRFSKEALVHAIVHEYFHVGSFYQNYNGTDELPSRVNRLISVVQRGLSSTYTEIYSVSGITRDYWADVIRAVKTCKDAKAEGKSAIAFKAFPKTKEIISAFKERYEKEWLTEITDYLVQGRAQISEQRSLHLDKRTESGVDINETLVEFLARVAVFEEPLMPSLKDLKTVEKRGFYRNLTGILDLTTLYYNIDVDRRIEMLKACYSSLRECQPDLLIKFLRAQDVTIKNSDFLEARLTSVASRVSPWKAIGNILKSNW